VRLEAVFQQEGSCRCALFAVPNNTALHAFKYSTGRRVNCAARYCSVEHQKEHWKVHKRWCEEVKAAEEEYKQAREKKPGD
jgi:MYND finger